MSTRCQIQVISEGLGWEEKVSLYKHCDGYPKGVLPLFTETIKKYGGDYKTGRAGKVASFLCASVSERQACLWLEINETLTRTLPFSGVNLKALESRL